MAAYNQAKGACLIEVSRGRYPPLIPKGRKIITGYGGGGFKINHEFVAGSLIVFPESVLSWDAAPPFTLAHFTPVLESSGIELLLLGTGEGNLPLDPAIRAALKAKGIATDVMNTGAACRTYNVLLSEERRVAAAVIAV